MTNIHKTGLYIIDESYKNEVNIEENIYVSFFVKNTQNNLVINIGKNAKLDLYGFFSNSCPENITINQAENNSSLNLKALFINHNCDLVSNIKSHISSNHSKSKIHIISIVKEHKIGIDSSIKIEKHCQKVQAKLDLENIFTGEKGTITSLPNLFIDSHDVQVSHSSKSHRLDRSQLFYLQSRGLDEKESIHLMTKSYFQHTFSCLEMLDRKIFESMYEDFFEVIFFGHLFIIH